VLLEFLHVCADEHLAELDKVTVFLVIDFNHTPGVATSTDFASLRRLDLSVGSDNGKRHLRHYLVVLGYGLVIIKVVARALEDVDLVVVNIRKNLTPLLTIIPRIIFVDVDYPQLERSNLFIGQGIRLGDDGNKVDFGMKSPHNLDIQGLQGVASGLDKVYTSVNAVVNDVHAVDLVLGFKVGIKTLLDIVDNWTP
jgi:hypothetical protein